MVKKTLGCRYPLQKQLFDDLKERYKSRGNDWISHYMSLAGLSKTPAYNRISGETAISFDEGLRLLQQEGVTFPFEPLSFTCMGQLDEEFMKDIRLFSQLGEKEVIMSIQDLPLLYLKMNRFLAGFKLYCAARFNSDPCRSSVEPFSHFWLEKPSVKEQLDKTKLILSQFRGLSRVDIWTLSMFDNTLRAVKYLEEVNGFLRPSIKEEVVASLFLLLEQLKEVASDPFGEVKVYENNIFSIGNQLLLHSPAAHVMYIWSDIDWKIRLSSEPLIRHHQKTLNNMLARATFIHPRSEYSFVQFFNRLEQRIRSSL